MSTLAGVATLIVATLSGVTTAGVEPRVALTADPTVAGFVEEALERSPDLARIRSTVQADQDRVPQVGSLPDPTLTLGIQNDGFQSIQIGTAETSFWQIMLTQPIPWPGKLGARQDVVRAQTTVVEAQLERVRLSTIADVERAYVDLLLVRGQIDLLSELEALWKEAEAIARTRYEVGQVSQSDLLRSQLERTRLEQQRIALESQERTKIQDLNTLRIRPLDEPIPTKRTLPELAEPPLRSEEEALSDAERRSPDLNAALLSVNAAERSLDSARQDWFPDLLVSAGVMPRGDLVPMWTAQIGITLPVFGATKQSKAVAENVSRREANAQGADATRQLVLLRARERRTLLAATVDTVKLYQGGLLVQSDAAVRSTLAQYKVGKVNFPSVLEVLRGLIIDEGGYLETLAGLQRVGIADREVSLASLGSMGGTLASSTVVPGVGAAGGGKSAAGLTGAGSEAAAPTSVGGMPSGM